MSAQNEKFQNHLKEAKSPYLLQHKNNPVDWYPWSDEAFAKAKKENKPIFLSIGYSTCHWCHVMAHESFENEQVASVINKYFVPIKVDREERPDIDNIYMSAVMAMTGSGGWPLTVFLTPDKKPFFGGTYFPPFAKWGAPGLMDVLNSINSKWQDNEKQIIDSSEQLTQMIADNARSATTEGGLDAGILDQAYELYKQTFDRTYGGFGSSPKFPSSHNLSFLMRYWYRTGAKEALEIVEKTLSEMARGGMYDHIGGGFHRYATDREWQIPHFEKMLYDQAMLSYSYAEAYQITKKEKYAQVTWEIFDYCLRDMRDKTGGFYSAEDADSLDPDEYGGMSLDDVHSKERKEGSFYLWRYEEIKDVLSDGEFSVFESYYAIAKEGNAHSDPHQEFVGKNVIFTQTTIKEVALKVKKSEEEVRQTLRQAKQTLLKHRSKRPRSYLDDKILVDWNGLMIGSLAFGGRVLGEEKYIKAAEDAANFILKNLKTTNGKLLHRYRLSDAAIEGSIEDYAFFISGLLELYAATGTIEYLEESKLLADQMVDLFWDAKDGGFYFTSKSSEALLFKQKEIYDGAIPSGNSVAANVLVRLLHITLNQDLDAKLEKMFKTFAGAIQAHPIGYAHMLSAFDFAIGPGIETVIAEGTNELTQNILEYSSSVYLPNHVMIVRPKDPALVERLLKVSPFVEEQKPLKDKTTVYVCQDHICKLPVSDLENFKKVIKPFIREVKE